MTNTERARQTHMFHRFYLKGVEHRAKVGVDGVLLTLCRRTGKLRHWQKVPRELIATIPMPFLKHPPT